MQASNRGTFIQMALTASLLTLSACNLADTKNGKSRSDSDTVKSSATFEVEKIDGKALEVKSKNSFGLPTEKIFNFSACLKDNRDSRAIQGHAFKIVEIDKEASTDKAGCLNWSESLEFNYLAESRYIQIQREIKAQGLHRGSRTISFAINPWAHGENIAAVLDADRNEVPQLVTDKNSIKAALKGLSSSSNRDGRTLWIEDGRLFVTEQNFSAQGVNLLVDMRLNPTVRLVKTTGDIVLRPLAAGRFKARLKLIHSYKNEDTEVRRPLAESGEVDANIDNGSLSIKTTMALAVTPRRGQVFMGLELTPVGGPEGLTSFDGVYMLGEYDQLKGSPFLKLNSVVSQSSDFKISKFITNMNKPLTQQVDKADEDLYRRPKIEVAPLEFRFIRVGRETTTTKEIFYNVKACLRSGFDQKTIVAHTFTVSKFRKDTETGGSKVDIKTDNSSCINWDESIVFNTFECNRYYKGYIEISNADLAMKERLDLIINPWEASYGVIGRDLRYVEKDHKLALNCEKEQRPKTTIHLDGYSYSTIGYSYKIDSLLNLTVIKKIQFRIDPHLLVYSSISSGRDQSSDLRDGIYLLKVAVVKNRNDDSNNTHVASTQKLVRVLNGQINAPLELAVSDLKALGNRNTLLVEIYPVQESQIDARGIDLSLKDPSQPLDKAIDRTGDLGTPTFQGPIVLNTDDANRPLELLDSKDINSFLVAGTSTRDLSGSIIAEVQAQGLNTSREQLRLLQAKITPEAFAKDNNLELINLKKLGGAGLQSNHGDAAAEYQRFTSSELKKIVSAGLYDKSASQKMCSFWVNEFMPSIYRSKGGLISKLRSTDLLLDCIRNMSDRANKFFLTDRRIINKELGGFRYERGLNHGLTVGTSFALSKAHSSYYTESTSIHSKLGISKKFFDLFSIGIDAGYSVSWSKSDAQSSSNAVSVNDVRTLTVQENIFTLKLNKYERCVIVRLDPALFLSGSTTTHPRYAGFLNERLTATEREAGITRGAMICEGEISNQPIERKESYFLVAQETGSTQIQDAGDERNRSFFVALRSTSDFTRFVTGIKGQVFEPKSARPDDTNQDDTRALMMKIFQIGSPSYPGMYIVK